MPNKKISRCAKSAKAKNGTNYYLKNITLLPLCRLCFENKKKKSLDTFALRPGPPKSIHSLLLAKIEHLSTIGRRPTWTVRISPLVKFTFLPIKIITFRFDTRRGRTGVGSFKYRISSWWCGSCQTGFLFVDATLRVILRYNSGQISRRGSKIVSII